MLGVIGLVVVGMFLPKRWSVVCCVLCVACVAATAVIYPGSLTH